MRPMTPLFAVVLLAATAVSEKHDFLYYGALGRGPEDWAALDAAYATCDLGRKQSPTPFHVHTQSRGLKPLEFTYHSVSGFRMLHKQSTITLEVPQGSDSLFVTDPNLGGRRFNATEIHLRSPSEHSFGGSRYPLEMQIMHGDGSERVGVSILFATGSSEDNPAMSFLSELPRRPLQGHEHVTQPGVEFTPTERTGGAGAVLDAGALVQDQRYYTYEGSDTLPPCREGVVWYVMRTPAAVSNAQVEAFRAAMDFAGELQLIEAQGYTRPTFLNPGNARPSQPRHGREVLFFSGSRGLRTEDGGEGDLIYVLAWIGAVCGPLAICLLCLLPLLMRALFSATEKKEQEGEQE